MERGHGKGCVSLSIHDQNEATTAVCHLHCSSSLYYISTSIHMSVKTHTDKCKWVDCMHFSISAFFFLSYFLCNPLQEESQEVQCSSITVGFNSSEQVCTFLV